ncbi:response regulator FixJ [Microvirga sp. M2]|uniref:response regulator FixJ n=1 Tax=Microvirga sp. M2 TaxID=3073270 RepID=UPI0039C2239B
MSSGAVVYVVDDDVGVRKALSFLLVSAGLNVRLYESASSFLREVSDPGRCCIVTDVRMPGIDGLEFIRRLNERGFNAPIIVMTGHADIPLAVEAMKAGAIDFLEKPFREDRFLEVVRFALVCDEKSVRRSQELLKTQARLQSLSQRERQVLDCLVEGKANKAIAHELNISIRTVEIHRSNVMAKMEARSLSELIRMALFVEAVTIN